MRCIVFVEMGVLVEGSPSVLRCVQMDFVVRVNGRVTVISLVAVFGGQIRIEVHFIA